MHRKKNEISEPQIEEMCEREKCACHGNFVLSALKHTLHITLFLLVFTLVMNLAVEWIGEDTIASILSDRPIVGSLLTGLVGLIPNCASSVFITTAYLEGTIAFGSCVAGLCANAGLGFVVLLRNTQKWKRNLLLVGVSYAVAVAVGLLCNLVINLAV